jgi:hypothetical protein
MAISAPRSLKITMHNGLQRFAAIVEGASLILGVT